MSGAQHTAHHNTTMQPHHSRQVGLLTTMAETLPTSCNSTKPETMYEVAEMYCEVCEMWLNGPIQWENHQIGKKHKKHLNALAKAPESKGLETHTKEDSARSIKASTANSYHHQSPMGSCNTRSEQVARSCSNRKFEVPQIHSNTSQECTIFDYISNDRWH